MACGAVSSWGGEDKVVNCQSPAVNKKESDLVVDASACGSNILDFYLGLSRILIKLIKNIRS